MKRSVLSLLTAILALSASAQSQSLFRGVLRVEDCAVREEGDSLRVDFDVRVDRDATRWFAGILFTPSITDGDPAREDVHFTAMPDIMLLGRNRNRAYERSVRMLGRDRRESLARPSATVRVSAGTDTLIHYTHAIPYETWMDTAHVTFHVETFGFRNERTLFTLTADGGVKPVPRIPYEIRPQVDFRVPAPEVKSRTKQGSACLDFPVNRTDILPGFRRNPKELARIFETLYEVQNEQDNIHVTGMFIEGYASVEGSYENNTRLARARAMSLRDYIVANFRLPLQADRIEVSWTPEDWEGLRVLVEQSDLEHREQILSIIDHTPVTDGRESALQHLAGDTPYRTLLREMLPFGRRVEYRIDYGVREFTVRETEQLINGKIHLLNQSELYNLAQSYGPDSEKYEEIMLDIIPRHYPDDVTAAVNAAAVMIRGGEYATARRVLTKFAADPSTWNNLGVIRLYEGDLDGAEELLQKASDNGVAEARHNLSELQKKRGDNIETERYRR